MEQYRDSKPSRWWPGYFAGYAIAFSVFQIPDFIDTDQEKAEEAQRYNQQLSSQIELSVGEEPQDTVVYIGDKQVTFKLANDRDCEADYDIRNDIASLSGRIVCKTTVVVADKSG